MRKAVRKAGEARAKKARCGKGKRGVEEAKKVGEKNLKKSVDKRGRKCYYTQAVTNERGKSARE